jgi:hypothetical protein
VRGACGYGSGYAEPLEQVLQRALALIENGVDYDLDA